MRTAPDASPSLRGKSARGWRKAVRSRELLSAGMSPCGQTGSRSPETGEHPKPNTATTGTKGNPHQKENISFNE